MSSISLEWKMCWSYTKGPMIRRSPWFASMRSQ
jgi:hypothetical protein